MIFSINRDVFLNYLTSAQKGLSTKTPMPILTGIKLDVYNNQIVITTSNSDVSIKVIVEDSSIKIENEGSVVIPGKYLIEIIRKITSREVKISVFDENMINITADRSSFTLNGMETENYPSISFDKVENPIKLDVKTIKSIIRQTTFATSSLENRPILTGVQLKIDNDKLTCIATDSYRLSQKIIDLKESYDNIDIIVPGKSLDEFNKILDNFGEIVNIHISNSKVLFEYNNVLFQSRLLEGNYPETSRLIPTEFPIAIKFNKDELLTAIERASLLTTRDMSGNIVKLYLRPDQIVEITSNSPEIGKVLEEVYPVEEVNGSSIRIAFSSKYFIDAIKVFNSAEIFVNFTGEIRPFVIKSELDENMTQLILPVRTD